MHDQSNAYQELIEENSFLKHRIKELEQAESDRKQMEVALQESERRLADIIDFLPDATFAIDLSGKVIAWNRAIEEMTGVKAEDMLGKGDHEYIIPFYGTRRTVLIDLVSGFDEELEKKYDFVKREGDVLLAEAEVPVRGVPHYLWGKARPLYDSHGNIVGAIESVRDITKLRKAQDDLEIRVRERTAELVQTNDALHESEERLKLCMEATNDGLWDWDIKTDGGYFSPGYYHMLGYEVGDFPVKGSVWNDLIHPDDRENALRANMDCIVGRNEKFEVEYRMKAKNGEWRWVLRRGKCVMRDEQGYAGRVVGTHVDITERRRMQKALQEQEEQYRNFFRTSKDCVFITSVDGHWIDLNDAAVQILGYDNREDLLKIKIPYLYVNPDDRERHKQLIDEYGYAHDMPIVLRKKDGTVIDTLITTIVKKDSMGRIIGYQGTIRDVTERKRAEEEKQRLEERLQQAEKMEALGTLAGGVAHDLNNVLGIVVGYAELLLMNADKSNLIRPQLENIMKGGQRAAAIVDDLLTLARRGVSDRQIQHLNKIIVETQRLPEFNKLHSYHPLVKIKTDLEPDLLNISGSSVHLSKTLFNLVLNAIEAMPKGGILTIKTANQYLEKPIQGYDEVRKGDYVVLSVSDTGEGITATNMKRIFEPFYTRKVMGRSGTGLGLAVVWGTVKDHQGYVNVQSEEGKGSTFTIYFPVAREEISSEAVALTINEYMGSGETILVVDDVKEQRDLATGMFRKLNYNVASVSSGEEAIKYVKEHHVDLMVLDMIMDPGMDGLDTYESVIEIHPKQKAIIVSGFSESNRVHDAQALGAGSYVRKPYTIEKLGLAARKELDRK